MIKFNRREFMQASTTSLLLDRVNLSAAPANPTAADESVTAFVRTDSEGKLDRGQHFGGTRNSLRSEGGPLHEGWLHKVTGKNFLKHLTQICHGGRKRGGVRSFHSKRTPLTWQVRRGARPLILSGWRRKRAISLRTANSRDRVERREEADEVSAFYAVYSGHPVVRKWIAITNRSDSAIRLSHMIFEALNLQAAPASDQIIFGYYGVHPREIFFTDGRKTPPSWPRTPGPVRALSS